MLSAPTLLGLSPEGGRVFEAVVVLSLFAALIIAGGRTGATQTDLDDPMPDLPCPWCHAPTQEDDTRCGNCGQRFG